MLEILKIVRDSLHLRIKVYKVSWSSISMKTYQSL